MREYTACGTGDKTSYLSPAQVFFYYFVAGAGYGFAGLETVKAFNLRTAIISLHHINTLVAALCELSYSQNAINTNNNPSKSNLVGVESHGQYR